MSAPVFVRLSGGSFGFQVGVQAADLVLFMMSERSIRSLLDQEYPGELRVVLVDDQSEDATGDRWL